MNVLCLIVDRLHAGYLGPYGHCGIDTPELDRLASQSLVCDQAFTDSADLAAVYASYWLGWHAAAGPPPADRPSLAQWMASAGLAPTLLTDERALVEHPLARDFAEIVAIAPSPADEPAEGVDDTHLAASFAETIAWLAAAREPFFLWCHLSALETCWDAPRDLRRRYLAEGDPEPLGVTVPPRQILQADGDPDEVFQIVQAYLGQVLTLDTCLGALAEFLDGHPLGRNTLVVLASPRSFPLGEHGRVGAVAPLLHEELVHVPWMIRWPDGQGAALRTQSLVQPADLYATLLDSVGIALPSGGFGRSLLPLVRGEEPELFRDRVLLTDGQEGHAMRTPAWFLRQDASPQLFAKPDDRYEFNDVASRLHELLDAMQSALAVTLAAYRAGRPEDVPPLDALLREGTD